MGTHSDRGEAHNQSELLDKKQANPKTRKTNAKLQTKHKTNTTIIPISNNAADRSPVNRTILPPNFNSISSAHSRHRSSLAPSHTASTRPVFHTSKTPWFGYVDV
jgi:hypothetical protein